ncbi:MAG TPA: sarcosine oxidase subunit gamma family protein, partial [Caulobacter sp.]|nr:sarcosine oxidase subunit gamma family protein [Caulobacter sp.]
PLAVHDEGATAALRLGPDEWLVLRVHDPAGAGPWPPGPPPEEPVSVVDVSDRQVAILISGVAAADLLNAGAPLDLSPAAFPVGRVARTVFGRVEVVIWRRSAESFHLEVWRSMAGYVWRILALAHADIISDPASLASRPGAAGPADNS